MTRDEALEILGLALAAYPTQASRIGDKPIAAMRAMWPELLADLEFNHVKAALLAHCRSAKFLPSPAELRELVTNGPSSGRSGIDAWGDVRRAISRYGVHRVPQFADPLVKRAVDAVGWTTICNSESEGVERAHFAKAYERFTADERAVAKMGDVGGMLAAAAANKLTEQLAGKLTAKGSDRAALPEPPRLEVVREPAPRKAGAR